MLATVVWLSLFVGAVGSPDEPRFASELIFPLDDRHNHAPGVVVCPDGSLLVSWYRGSGERRADDVAVLGARRRRGESSWSEPFLLADVPGFPDCNTTLHIDERGRLWLFWPTILANTWESCLTNYRVSSDYLGDGPPTWDWQGTVLIKPRRFVEVMRRELDARLAEKELGRPDDVRDVAAFRALIEDRLSQRLGWQPRCKPTVLPSGRWLLPLYSDTYSVSLMAISDDGGATWTASEPLAGFGNIQPAVLRRRDGTLVAYMRENGPIQRVRVAESRDDGVTWGKVGACELENPGSGLDALQLASGAWILVHNDTRVGRTSLAVSLSEDEGRTWPIRRHLERRADGKFHYPAVVQAADGTIHCVYSFFVEAGRSMRHAAFDETWIRAGNSVEPAAPERP